MKIDYLINHKRKITCVFCLKKDSKKMRENMT